ncbi:hypothetical protein [Porphyromonas pogonae]|nr:hypothetical protein [Porphyromonas pogonae]
MTKRESRKQRSNWPAMQQSHIASMNGCFHKPPILFWSIDLLTKSQYG